MIVVTAIIHVDIAGCFRVLWLQQVIQPSFMLTLLAVSDSR